MSKLRWWLAHSSTMELIDELRAARSKSISEDLGQPGSASFRIPIDDDVAMKMDVVKTCVVIKRGSRTCWSGPLWTIVDDADESSGWTTVGCKGWLTIPLRRLVNPGQRETINAEAYIHAHTLLAKANAVGPVLPGAPSSTMIVPGLAGTNGVVINKTYETFTNVGQAIQDLTKIENGVDIAIDPATRTLDVYTLRGEYRENLVWRLRSATTRPTLARAQRTIDADRFGNKQWVVGANGITGHADDFPSQDDYGLFEEQTALSDVADASILGAYANAEVLAKGRPITIYELTPTSLVEGETPVIYEDVFTGDIGRFTIDRGRLAVPNQAVRLFGFTLQDGDDGVEKITSLKLEASG